MLWQAFGRWGGFAAAEPADIVIPASMVLLLNMEGADTGTTFIDESPSAHAITVSGAGGMTTSTARFKEGTSSALFTGGGGPHLQIADSGDFDFGAGAFTIGLWSYHTDTNDFLIGQRNGSPSWSLLMVSAGAEFNFPTTGTDVQLIGGSSLSNQWVHHAVSRNSSGLIRLRQNGVVVASTTEAAAMDNVTSVLRLGRSVTDAASYQMSGNMDQVFIVKGVDLFDTDDPITPPDTTTELLAFFP